VTASLHDALSRRLDDATQALDAAAGSSSLCSLSRAGVSMPGIKYPEGAWAALRDAQRAIRSGGEADVRLCEVRDRWAVDLARHEQRGSGPDWIAYLTGGVDALDRVLEDSRSAWPTVTRDFSANSAGSGRLGDRRLGPNG